MKDVIESLAGRVGILNLYSLSNSEINSIDNTLFRPKIEELKGKISLLITARMRYLKEYF